MKIRKSPSVADLMADGKWRTWSDIVLNVSCGYAAARLQFEAMKAARKFQSSDKCGTRMFRLRGVA